MKYFLVFLFFSTSAIPAYSQNISGTWEGYLSTDMGSFTRIYKFTVQLQQKERAVWGIYTTRDSTKIKTSCTCKISGQTNKNHLNFISFYQQGVIAYDIRYEICNFINYLQVEQFNNELGKELMTGRWYGQFPSNRRHDNASGNFALRKISNDISENVDVHFTNLNKLIGRLNKRDTSYNNERKLVVHKTESSEATPGIIPAAQRENIVLAEIPFDTSFIYLSFYDNGVIDDDIISVYINDQVILKNYKLTATPKEILINLDEYADHDIFIVAENLGTIPPNTGVMLIKTKKDRFHINLSSSFENNALVILKSVKE